MCEALTLNEDGSKNCTLQFLENAIAIFKQWEASGLSGLNSETFTACIQSMEAMLALAPYLISKHGFRYVFPGKFTSDPIEGRFGWYRQVNGGNFYMSTLQLFQAEKKIRCLSLFRQNALHTLASLNIRQPVSIPDSVASTEDITWLKYWSAQVEVDEVNDDDAAVTYYVAGCIGRCISRRRKCSSCKDQFVETKHIPTLSDISEAKDVLLALADRGGLSPPKQYCFAICALGVQVYNQIRQDDNICQQFLCLNNQQATFVDILTQIVQGKTGHAFLVDQLCENGHCNFVPIVQSPFNCFAKNELKRINQCEIKAPAKISKLRRGLKTCFKIYSQKVTIFERCTGRPTCVSIPVIYYNFLSLTEP